MPKSHYELVGDWHTVVWQGDTPAEKRRSRTTWPTCTGAFWEYLNGKLIQHTLTEQPVTLTFDEVLAIRSVLEAYVAVLDAPEWRRRAVRRAMRQRGK